MTRSASAGWRPDRGSARLPYGAGAWTVAYAAVHAVWASRGAPRFTEPGESFLPEGWFPVAVSMLATATVLLVGSGSERRRRTALRWLVAALGWISGVSLLLYSFMFPLTLLMVLGGVFGMEVSSVDWATLLAQGSGCVGGALTISVAIREQRRARGACRHCGRTECGSPESRETPWWAVLAGYAAVVACLTRFAAEVLHGFLSSKAPEVPWAFLVTFVVLMFLAGTLLPLALVHRWGRIWPGWVRPLAGRGVPRWLVLGPGYFVGAGLTGYFGVGGMTAWATGDNVDGAAWFLAVVLPAYTVWGVGLLVAASSYVSLTKPTCAPTYGKAPRPGVRCGHDERDSPSDAVSGGRP
ncbi:hypothetical protein [Micromonospora taraxaci]|uniref:hypothetical protein n=1 Tax=Micromonospora taraxaci TaxID=1316803 RepID=UPI0033BAB9F4